MATSRPTRTELKTELVRIADYYERVWRATKQLDSTAVRIIKGIQKLGPRNLLAVSRYTRIPFSSVYIRMGKLEAAGGPVAFASLNTAKLGLAQAVVLTSAKPGREDRVTEALKIPRYWRMVIGAEGGYTHDAFYYVPFQYVKAFQQFMKSLVTKRLAEKTTILMLGDYLPNNINFDYYDPKKRTWKFSWNDWLRGLSNQKPRATIEDPKDYSLAVDRRDLEILKQLQTDARMKFVDLAKPIGITLQAVKYRFDRKLVKNKIIGGYTLTPFPYPPEMAAYYHVMVDFPSKYAMNKFYSYLNHLFFVVGRAKVLKSNSLILRVIILDSQVPNMFRFLSELCRRRVVASYSALRLRLDSREKQTIPIELFDDKTGWAFDLERKMAELRKLS
jgi:DNA-binding Lrp family transcriptional regulator